MSISQPRLFAMSRELPACLWRSVMSFAPSAGPSRLPSCPVCSKRFRLTLARQIPKLLPCGHSVCAGCVESAGKAACPCCKTSNDGLESLPDNIVLAMHAEKLIASAAGDGSAATCDGCRADGLDPPGVVTHKWFVIFVAFVSTAVRPCPAARLLAGLQRALRQIDVHGAH